MVKKHCSRFRMLLVSIILPVGILSLLLTGCNNEDKNYHENVVKNAEAYYESKYGEKAAINDLCGWKFRYFWLEYAVCR